MTTGKSTLTRVGLTEFLMARIAEDEAAAIAVKDLGADVWYVDVVRRTPDLHSVVSHSTDDARTRLAQHFDQTRVLAGCDSMRLIVAIHSPYQPAGEFEYAPDWASSDWCVGCGFNSREERVTLHIDECPILRALSLRFADHPDFSDRWNG